METHLMFMDWKAYNCYNVRIIQSDLQIQCNLYQNPNDLFLAKIKKKKILKFKRTLKGPQIVKTVLKKRTRLEESYFLISKLATVIKTVWYWHKDRHTDQWSRKRSLVLLLMPRSFNGGKDNLFNKWFWKNWISTCEGMKLALYLTPYIKTNSKWIRP